MQMNKEIFFTNPSVKRTLNGKEAIVNLSFYGFSFPLSLEDIDNIEEIIKQFKKENKNE